MREMYCMLYAFVSKTDVDTLFSIRTNKASLQINKSVRHKGSRSSESSGREKISSRERQNKDCIWLKYGHVVLLPQLNQCVVK